MNIDGSSMRKRSDHLIILVKGVSEVTYSAKNVNVRKAFVLSSRIRVAEGSPKKRKSEKQ